MGCGRRLRAVGVFFFFNDTATTEIYTLSLHDALPIYDGPEPGPTGRVLDALRHECAKATFFLLGRSARAHPELARSEEHTSELQSQSNLVCRLLLEKKNRRKWMALALLSVVQFMDVLE